MSSRGETGETSIGGFMNLKSFHPSSFHNQKKVWTARENLRKQKNAEDIKAQELEAERRREEQDSLFFSRMSTTQKDRHEAARQVDFLYQEPQSFKAFRDKQAKGHDTTARVAPR